MTAIAAPSTDCASLASFLSELIGQTVQPEQVSKLVTFTCALSAILLGVTCADQKVSVAEKERLNEVFNTFVPKSSPVRSLVSQLFQAVKQQRVDQQSEQLDLLMGDLSESEVLLLLAFGYELATADGEADLAEVAYLEAIAQRRGLDLRLTSTIEACLTEAAMIDGDAVAEVRYLLDPARFSDLDPVFSLAASQISGHLLEIDRAIATERMGLSYAGLEQFQAQKQHLIDLSTELKALLDESADRFSFPDSLTADLTKIQGRLDSQRFRVAIVGEFSQGKSTLLNALLCEEIQPVRAIPCSGTVTVLRHGDRLRVIARYRDGREEEIPFEQYQDKASISEETALANRDDALSSDLLELVLEHPGLELCRQGVELVDSPGLNEHPERSRVTHQLLDQVDAVIFLANAQRPLTQGERELLHDLRQRLNSGDASRSAENLFVVVNFMDLLRREKDQQQVKQLFENFLLGEEAIISGRDRLHFISAQDALDAIIEGISDAPCLMDFQSFRSSLECCLIGKKNEFRLAQSVREISGVMKQILLRLQDRHNHISKKFTISVETRRQLIETIGEASGLFSALENKIKQLQSEFDCDLQSSVHHFLQTGFVNEIWNKANSWETCDQINRDRLVKSFRYCFERDSEMILQNWVQEMILEDVFSGGRLKSLDQSICELTSSLEEIAVRIDENMHTNFVQQFRITSQDRLPNLALKSYTFEEDFWQGWSAVLGGGIGLGAGGVIGAGVAAGVTAIAAIPIALPIALTGAAVAGVAGIAGATIGFFSAADADAIKKEILEERIKNVLSDKTRAIICDSIHSVVISLFEERSTMMSHISSEYLMMLNSRFDEHEQSSHCLAEERDVYQEWYKNFQNQFQILKAQIN